MPKLTLSKTPWVPEILDTLDDPWVELVAFQSYLMMTMFPMIMLGSMMMVVAQASAGAERIV